jgi:hypothetical protein
MSRPLADFRSPFSGNCTTSRSPVRRRSSPVDGDFFARARRGFAVLVDFAPSAGVVPGMHPSLASVTG